MGKAVTLDARRPGGAMCDVALKTDASIDTPHVMQIQAYKPTSADTDEAYQRQLHSSRLHDKIRQAWSIGEAAVFVKSSIKLSAGFTPVATTPGQPHHRAKGQLNLRASDPRP